MKKTEILMNKPVCLGLSILELSNIVINDLWYDFVKSKYGKIQNYFILYYFISFTVYIKADDI